LLILQGCDILSDATIDFPEDLVFCVRCTFTFRDGMVIHQAKRNSTGLKRRNAMTGFSEYVFDSDKNGIGRRMGQNTATNTLKEQIQPMPHIARFKR
jgi:hypothetical protein